MVRIIFPFTSTTLPDSYFSKEKTVKKKVKRAVVKPERENYKSRQGDRNKVEDIMRSYETANRT